MVEDQELAATKILTMQGTIMGSHVRWEGAPNALGKERGTEIIQALKATSKKLLRGTSRMLAFTHNVFFDSLLAISKQRPRDEQEDIVLNGASLQVPVVTRLADRNSLCTNRTYDVPPIHCEAVLVQCR